MSDSGDGIIGQFSGRALLFLIVAIISAPFMVVGNYKNGQIEKCLEAAGNCMLKSDYIAGKKKMDEGANHFGVLYDLYIILPSFGGKYYQQKDYFGVRGISAATAIAQHMGEGNLDVEDLIKEGLADLETRGSFTSETKPLREIARQQIATEKKLLPIMKICKEGSYQKAYTQFQAFLADKENIKYDVIFMPICKTAVDLAEHAPTRRAGEVLLEMVSTVSKNSDNPFFKEMQNRASMIDLDKPRSSATTASSSASAAPASKKPLKAVVAPEPVRANSDNIEEKFTAALALARKKDFGKALPMLEACYKERPSNDNICYALALTKKGLGQSNEAKVLCEEMLQRNAANAKAQKLLASIK